jgi:hypothetical protein
MTHRLQAEDKEQILEMYKCHYTAKEVACLVPFGYGTIITYFRSFDLVGVSKYDRLNLIPEEMCNDAKCYSR